MQNNREESIYAKKVYDFIKKSTIASCKCINALLEKNIYNHRMVDYTKQ